jgi:5-methylcytosine-specific restriction endonuclease McrA
MLRKSQDWGLYIVDGRLHCPAISQQLKARRPDVPRAIRRQVLERDRRRCVRCGRADYLQLDHVIRWRDGGAQSVENLRVLCGFCNRARG